MNIKSGHLFNQLTTSFNYKDNKNLIKIKIHYRDNKKLNQVKTNYKDNKNNIEMKTNYSNNKDNFEVETNYSNNIKKFLLYLYLTNILNIGKNTASMAKFDIMQTNLLANPIIVSPKLLISIAN